MVLVSGRFSAETVKMAVSAADGGSDIGKRMEDRQGSVFWNRE